MLIRTSELLARRIRQLAEKRGSLSVSYKQFGLMRIILSGGGTLGPVTPLLAIYETIKTKYPEAEFLWVGTRQGPERQLVEKAGIKFVTLSSGKFRRYFSIFNLVDIFRIIIGFFQSIKIIWRFSPDLCISAGGFISVPLHWAAWWFGTPTWIHQQDARVGLANKLMAPIAKLITTSTENLVKKFSIKKTYWLGNPVRAEILAGTRERAVRRFGLDPNLPVVFATGGGTGSLFVNQMVVQAVTHLRGICQIIHLSGIERPQELVERTEKQFADCYHHFQFFASEMPDAYAVADIVVSRGGFGTIAEIAALGKPAILVPKPGHQFENVRFLDQGGAAILVDERVSDGNFLAKTIRELLADKIKMNQMGQRINRFLPRAEENRIIDAVDFLVR